MMADVQSFTIQSKDRMVCDNNVVCSSYTGRNPTIESDYDLDFMTRMKAHLGYVNMIDQVERLTSLMGVQKPTDRNLVEMASIVRDLKENRHDMFGDIVEKSVPEMLNGCDTNTIATKIKMMKGNLSDYSTYMTPDGIMEYRGSVNIVDYKSGYITPLESYKVYDKYSSNYSKLIKGIRCNIIIMGYNPEPDRLWIMTQYDNVQVVDYIVDKINSLDNIKDKISKIRVLDRIITTVVSLYRTYQVFMSRLDVDIDSITSTTDLSIEDCLRASSREDMYVNLPHLLKSLNVEARTLTIGSLLYGMDNTILKSGIILKEITDFWHEVIVRYQAELDLNKLLETKYIQIAKKIIEKQDITEWPTGKAYWEAAGSHRYRENVNACADKLMAWRPDGFYSKEPIKKLLFSHYVKMSEMKDIELTHTATSRAPFACFIPTSFVAINKGSYTNMNDARVDEIIKQSCIKAKGLSIVKLSKPDHWIEETIRYEPGKIYTYRKNRISVEAEIEFLGLIFSKRSFNASILNPKRLDNIEDEELMPGDGLTEHIRRKETKDPIKYHPEAGLITQGVSILIGTSVPKASKVLRVRARGGTRQAAAFMRACGVGVKVDSKPDNYRQKTRSVYIKPMCLKCRSDMSKMHSMLREILSQRVDKEPKNFEIYRAVLDGLKGTNQYVENNRERAYDFISKRLSFKITEDISQFFKGIISTSIAATSPRLKIHHSSATDMVIIQIQTSSALNQKNSILYISVKIYNKNRVFDTSSLEHKIFLIDRMNSSYLFCDDNHIYMYSKPMRLDIVRANRLAMSTIQNLLSFSVLSNTGNKNSLNYAPHLAIDGLVTSFLASIAYTKGLNIIAGNAHHMQSLAIAEVSPLRSFIDEKYAYGVKSVTDFVIDTMLIDFIEVIQNNDCLSYSKRKEILYDDDGNIINAGMNDQDIISPLSGLRITDVGDVTNEIYALVYATSKSMHNRTTTMRKLVETPAEYQLEYESISNGKIILDSPTDGCSLYTMDTVRFIAAAMHFMVTNVDRHMPKVREFLAKKSKFDTDIAQINTMTKNKSSVIVESASSPNLKSDLYLEETPGGHKIKGNVSEMLYRAGVTKKLGHDNAKPTRSTDTSGSLNKMQPVYKSDRRAYLSGRLDDYIFTSSAEVRDTLARSMISRDNTDLSVKKVTDGYVKKVMDTDNISDISPVISMFDKGQKDKDDREIYMAQLGTKISMYGLDSLANSISSVTTEEMIHISGRHKVRIIQEKIQRMTVNADKKKKELEDEFHWRYSQLMASISIDESKFSAKDNPIKFMLLLFNMKMLTLREKLKWFTILSVYLEKKIIIPDNVMISSLKYHDVTGDEDFPIYKVTEGLKRNYFIVNYNWLQGNFNYFGSLSGVICQSFITSVLREHINTFAESLQVDPVTAIDFNSVDFTHSDDGLRKVLILLPSRIKDVFLDRYISYGHLLLEATKTLQLGFSLNMSISKTHSGFFEEFLSEIIINGDLLPTISRYISSLMAPSSFSSPAEDVMSRVGSLANVVRELCPPEIYAINLFIANYVGYMPYHMLPGGKNDPEIALKSVLSSGFVSDQYKGLRRIDLPVAIGGYCIITQEALAIMGPRSTDAIKMLRSINKQIGRVNNASERHRLLSMITDNRLISEDASVDECIKEIEATSGIQMDLSSYIAISMIQPSVDDDVNYFADVDLNTSTGLSILAIPDSYFNVRLNLSSMVKYAKNDVLTGRNQLNTNVKLALEKPSQVVGRSRSNQMYCIKKLYEIESSFRGIERGVDGLTKGYAMATVSNSRVFMPVNLELSLARASSTTSVQTLTCEALPLYDSLIREIRNEMRTYLSFKRQELGLGKATNQEIKQILNDLDDDTLDIYEEYIREVETLRSEKRRHVINSTINDSGVIAGLDIIRGSVDREISYMTKYTIYDALRYTYTRLLSDDIQVMKHRAMSRVKGMMASDVRLIHSYDALFNTRDFASTETGIRTLQRVTITKTDHNLDCPVDDACAAFCTNDKSILREGHSSELEITNTFIRLGEIASSAKIMDSIIEIRALLKECDLWIRDGVISTNLERILGSPDFRYEISERAMLGLNHDIKVPDSNNSISDDDDFDIMGELPSDDDLDLDIDLGLEIISNEEDHDEESVDLIPIEIQEMEISKIATIPMLNVDKHIVCKAILDRAKTLSTFLGNIFSVFVGRETCQVLRKKIGRDVVTQIVAIVGSNKISNGYKPTIMAYDATFTSGSSTAINRNSRESAPKEVLTHLIEVVRRFEAIGLEPSKRDYLEVIESTLVDGRPLMTDINRILTRVLREPYEYVKFLAPLYHLGLISKEVILTGLKTGRITETWSQSQEKINEGDYIVIYHRYPDMLEIKGSTNSITKIQHWGPVRLSGVNESILDMIIRHCRTIHIKSMKKHVSALKLGDIYTVGKAFRGIQNAQSYHVYDGEQIIMQKICDVLINIDSIYEYRQRQPDSYTLVDFRDNDRCCDSNRNPIDYSILKLYAYPSEILDSDLEVSFKNVGLQGDNEQYKTTRYRMIENCIQLLDTSKSRLGVLSMVVRMKNRNLKINGFNLSDLLSMNMYANSEAFARKIEDLNDFLQEWGVTVNTEGIKFGLDLEDTNTRVVISDGYSSYYRGISTYLINIHPASRSANSTDDIKNRLVHLGDSILKSMGIMRNDIIESEWDSIKDNVKMSLELWVVAVITYSIGFGFDPIGSLKIMHGAIHDRYLEHAIGKPYLNWKTIEQIDELASPDDASETYRMYVYRYTKNLIGYIPDSLESMLDEDIEVVRLSGFDDIPYLD